MVCTRRANQYSVVRGTNTRWISVGPGTNRTTEREGDVTSVLASHPQLTADDRCDRCGAQAYIRVTLAAGGELLFCAHHGHAHEDKLREMSLEFQDERSRLAATPATAPDTEK